MSVTELQELVRFLEDRFACAQACTECARVCALRASLADIDGPEGQQLIRRKGMLCTEVCDATCRLLAEQVTQSEDTMRSQVEWCRTVCLETAQVFDADTGTDTGTGSGSGESAQACRDCARACTEFLAQLR
ncbi:ferredoxin [Streptomyces dioscori]|uniref:Ferredoxin n=1 Tax=Streptomyces dioscori TaxID=2109333 RepID=A0A2P8Q3E6_9ACTN|nr:ferredoxin [Streptomyces dioscori]PSM40777.1 ferredoxin [Streptomyces dioscori]